MSELTVSIATAKARLSELVNAVEAGDQVVITRRGRPVATLTATSQPLRRSFDIGWLRGMTAEMELTADSLGDIRQLRTEARY